MLITFLRDIAAARRRGGTHGSQSPSARFNSRFVTGEAVAELLS
jgi:hypothetical protein